MPKNKKKYISYESKVKEVDSIIINLQLQLIGIEKSLERVKNEVFKCNSSFKQKLFKKLIRFLDSKFNIQYYINILNKEKNLTILKTNLITLKSKIVEKENIKKFLLNKLEYNSHLTYNRIIYSPELREEVQNWNLENPNEKAVIKVTEHAILRYLERVKGIDMESIKREMVPDELKEKALKNGDYEINKLKYIVQGKQVITVIHKKVVKKILNLDSILNDKKYNSYRLRKGVPLKYLNLYNQRLFLKNK
ncbi:hypothetical protein H5J22_00450 [Cetobacterium sp. 8H]|uniref:hypothetical protein n=1 Tax=Cetobacterium sp. 8H TaxID=2759681 RepID=UPI00163CF6F5|nr:hypothetical protein [Cetobacterium sp. 8H]MBC2849929.1 hypothetical protein [Cetobacterium sp. 8H]